MSRLLRTFLVWFMVCAMPAQGIAASRMVFCGPSHGPMVLGALEASKDAEKAHASHSHGDRHGHSEEHAVTGHADSDSAAHHGDAGCSACAACCVAVSVPSTLALPESGRPQQAERSTLIERFASHHPAALERPPRTAFA